MCENVPSGCMCNDPELGGPHLSRRLQSGGTHCGPAAPLDTGQPWKGTCFSHTQQLAGATQAGVGDSFPGFCVVWSLACPRRVEEVGWAMVAQAAHTVTAAAGDSAQGWR